jgi:DNA-binding transcriptional LysR family regulator
MRWADRIGRQLKLRDLHIFLTVVQCGSMTKAASQLSVSNPVISKAIADMEHTFGVRLVDRRPQGVEPTMYGRALLDRGLAAFDELRQAVSHIEFLADPSAGELRIGASIVLASGIGAATIDQLSRRYPGIVFHLFAGESGLVYRALEERKVDLAVSHIFAPVPPNDADVEILYEECQAVVAGEDNPWTRRRKVTLADLVNEPWVLPPPDTLTGSVVAEAFHASDLDVPRGTVITSTTPVRNALVATGRFLTIVSNSVLTFSRDNTRLKRLPISLPTTRRSVGIIALKNRTLSPVAQLFIDSAREIAKSLR